VDYILSDNHWFHGNILKYEHRNFLTTHEMDDHMITEWNAVIGKNDLVYHCGDIAFTNNFHVLMRLLQSLNGKIYLIPGNHDHSCQRNGVPRFEWIENKLFIGDSITEKKVNIGGKYEKVTMCHYPINSYNAKSHGRLHFYGHVHSNSNLSLKNSFNVSVDEIGYRPLTFNNVLMHYKNKYNFLRV